MFENKHGMGFRDAINLCKSYFTEYLPDFELVQEYHEKTGFWGLKYSHNAIMIFISCDRGYLENEITINGTAFSLIEFEPLTEHIQIVSEKNIRFLLDTIRKLIETKA